MALPIIHLGVSPTPIGCTPGHLSMVIRWLVTRGVMPCGSTYVVQSFCATDANPAHKSAFWKDVHKRLQLLAATPAGPAEPVVQSVAL